MLGYRMLLQARRLVKEWVQARLEITAKPDPTARRVRWLFLRGLAVVSCIAFLSLLVQVEGLFGPDGVRPFAIRMASITQEMAYSTSPEHTKYVTYPSLFWLSSSDLALKLVLVVGLVASLLLFINLVPRISLILIWVCYLSFVSLGDVFMSFQWDTLLLETVLLAIFFAPSASVPELDGPPPTTVAVFALRLLLFKLMFLSGLFKFFSEDASWRSLEALTYHFETQPLPTPLAWHAHHLPDPVLQAGTAGTLVVELLVPWLLFTRYRAAAAVTIAFHQVAVFLTGNYAWFNLLTICLCVVALTDDDLARARATGAAILARLPGAAHRNAESAGVLATASAGGRRVRAAMPSRKQLWPRDVTETTGDDTGGTDAKILVVIVLVNVFLIGTLVLNGIVPGLGAGSAAVFGNFYALNTYAPFSEMTTEQPVLIIEGSQDGDTWREYEFRYAPDDPAEPLPLVAPHHPRIEWRLWFASVAKRPPRWMKAYLFRLSQNEPGVTSHLESNPFPDDPPTHVRAVKYRYEFTDPATRKETGRIWTRERRNVFLSLNRTNATS